MTYTLEEARQAVISVALRLKESDLIVRTYGNISCRVNEDQFVITPSGRDYETLKSEDIVLMNISDGSYEGNILPSSEYLVHRITYKLHPGAECVIHTHQAAASALSILGRRFLTYRKYNSDRSLWRKREQSTNEGCWHGMGEISNVTMPSDEKSWSIMLWIISSRGLS